MTHTINIEGINIYAYHGCLEHEAQTGCNYVIDVYITTDFSKPAASDELADAIDYCTVYAICEKEMAIRNKLIEPVCQRIFQKIKSSFKDINTLRVRLTKVAPPIKGNVDKVSVEIFE